MMYKKIFAVLIVALMVIGLSCAKKETGIKGRLILQTGQSGDVRNCRVRLFVSSDLTGNAVKEVASDATGVDQTKSEFEITNVVEGYYYLLAWKDLNTNGIVDNLDIVGIHGGTYRPGYGGTQVTVKEGKMTDVGDIVMYIYRELILTTRYEADANGFLSFIYSFNDACTVTTWGFTGPGGIQANDPTQAGAKAANTEYRSEWWNMGGGAMPAGTYIITITGTWSGSAFALSDTLNVAK
jgi:hypothetical protein